MPQERGKPVPCIILLMMEETMKYTITEIIEPDFGCEGLPEGGERMDTVLLLSEDGTRHTAAVSDELLYRLGLDVGSECTAEQLRAEVY